MQGTGHRRAGPLPAMMWPRAPLSAPACHCLRRNAVVGLGRVSSSVSVAAVKTYLARVFTKLGARDRARLVVVGYEARLVSLPGTSDR